MSVFIHIEVDGAGKPEKISREGLDHRHLIAAHNLITFAKGWPAQYLPHWGSGIVTYKAMPGSYPSDEAASIKETMCRIANEALEAAAAEVPQFS